VLVNPSILISLLLGGSLGLVLNITKTYIVMDISVIILLINVFLLVLQEVVSH
jgi:hypothetical protein